MLKRIGMDFFYNILATLLPIAVLQFLIFPKIAHVCGGEAYGFLISIYSFFCLLPSAIGTALNNMRLIRNEWCNTNSKNCDFQSLFYISESICIFLTVVLSYFYFKVQDIVDILGIVLVTFLWLFREYYLVEYRIYLNFKHLFFNNLLLSVGYLLGYYLFLITSKFWMLFFSGLIISDMYIIKTTKIWSDKLTKGTLFYSLRHDYMILLIATFLARILPYADKLMLFPLLGTQSVSIYYIASLIGKIVGLGLNPINSVGLSYLSKINNKPDVLFKKLCIWCLVLCIFVYIIVDWLSIPVLYFFYPSYIDIVLPYVSVCTVSMCTMIYASIITPFVLRFFDFHWQIIINLVSAITYITCAFIFLQLYGLYGFCIAGIVGNLSRCVLTVYIYFCQKSRCEIC